MSELLELGDNTKALLAFPWRPNSTGRSLGTGNPFDEKTGYSYDVTIEWDDPDNTELGFYVTHDHHAEMDEMLQSMPEDHWNRDMPPSWIIDLVNQLEASIKAQR